MEQFVEKFKNDPEFKKEFIAFMHNEESQVGESFKVIYENLNKQVMASIIEFAKQKDMKLEDSQAIQDLFKAQCKTMADQMNKAVIEQVAKAFA